MKIRSGFVSNSSSSSFIVMLPHEPADLADMQKMLFPEGQTVVSYYDNVLTVDEVTATVFYDFKNQNKLNVSEILNTMATVRYRYYPQDNVIWTGRVSDEFGGAFMFQHEKWFGTDKNALDKIRQLAIKEKQEEIAYWKRHHALRSKYPGKQSGRYDPDEYKVIADWMEKQPEFKQLEESKPVRTRDERIKYALKVAISDFKAFRKDSSSGKLGYFTYSDNDGPAGVVMEHGGIFDNVPHIQLCLH